MGKSHAEHNESLCDFLLADERFNDWVVTSAFYSALHYVQNELFPLTTEGTTYESFNEYHNALFKRKSKHSITIMLVSQHLPLVSAYYRWLFDNCMTARYRNYVVSMANAIKAREHLTELKSRLSK